MTVLEVITSAAGYLEKHGVEHPRLNAEHLLAHALGRKRRLDLYMEFDRPLGDAERAPLRESIKARAAGVPLQHLLGTAEFFGRTFLSDARALIPRPETEQLVEFVLKSGKTLESPAFLDVGTGSGVIAITLALENPGSTVIATDLSTDALALATENAARLEATGRVQFEHADLLPTADIRPDFVVANLPYIPSADLPGLAREVRHDPASALDGGADGLDLIRRLASDAAARWQHPFHLALEIGCDQSAAVSDLLSTHNFRDIHVERDYQGVDRFVFAQHG